MLEFELDDLDSVDEAHKSLYQEHNGKFRLAVNGIDPADELKGALEKEREARRLAKEKLSQYEQEREQEREAARQAELEALEKAGEWEKLYKLEQEHKQAALKEKQEYQSKVAQKEVQSEISELAVSESAKAEWVKYLKREFESYAKHDGDKVTYEIDGVPATKEQVVERVRADNKDLVKGSGMSGGGNGGSNSNGNGVPSTNAKREKAIAEAKAKGDMKALRAAHNIK